MADSIVDGTNIDVNVFEYSKPKPNPTGGKVVNLLNKHFKQSLTISTPLMLTWGAQEGQDPGTKLPNGKWSMALQFPSDDYATPEATAFLRSMRAIESAVKRAAMKNSVEWFGKEIKSEEVIEEKFNVMLRHPKVEKNSAIIDYNRPPTLTVKIPQWKGGVWKPEVYDEDGEPLYINGKTNSHLSPLEFLKPKSHVICLIQCGGLWFVNGKISITWNLLQAMVQKPKATIEGTCFLRPKNTEKERMKTLPPPEDDIDPDGAPTTIVDDSDDEDLNMAKASASHVPEPIAKPVEEPVVSVPAVEEVEEIKVAPKKKLVRKKADA
jgi:hypothetical protein